MAPFQHSNMAEGRKDEIKLDKQISTTHLKFPEIATPYGVFTCILMYIRNPNA